MSRRGGQCGGIDKGENSFLVFEDEDGGEEESVGRLGDTSFPLLGAHLLTSGLVRPSAEGGWKDRRQGVRAASGEEDTRSEGVGGCEGIDERTGRM